MSITTTTTANYISTELSELAGKINEAHQACVGAQLNALHHALECGRIGEEAKSKLKHGEFLPWIEKHTRVGRRTMQVYMQIADRWPEIEAKAQSAAHLSLAAALKLLADDSHGRRLNNAEQVIEAAGYDLAVDMVGAMPPLNATTVKKLAMLPPEKIRRATRFDVTPSYRGYLATKSIRRCKEMQKPVVPTEPTETTSNCVNCGGGEFDEDGDCVRCLEPQEVARQSVAPAEDAVSKAMQKLGSDVRRLATQCNPAERVLLQTVLRDLAWDIEHGGAA